MQAARPIVIVDEPQSVDSTEKSQEALKALNPLCTLRYSATHKNLYNLVYKLDPVQAYDLGPVKQIEVDSVFASNDRNRAFIQIEGFKAAKKSVAVRLKIDVNAKNYVEQKSITAKTGDDLYILSNSRETYKDGYIVNNIDAREGSVEFSNGDILYKGQTHGGLNDQIMKYQMEKVRLSVKSFQTVITVILMNHCVEIEITEKSIVNSNFASLILQSSFSNSKTWKQIFISQNQLM